MFLKRIELQGFKSFPDNIVINFNHAITGIVGPNGCGKSNITDAVKWVLGEQSVKNMRGSSMSDVIFSGSQSRKRVNVATVSLVFDNSDQRIDTDLEEIEITRKLHRESGEGEYYINKKPVRLKDVQDLTLEYGLGRDSLSIISQGTVSQFADQKPSERRGLFEDAAGVTKYKKRKIEALSKLSRTQDNIDRLLDIVNELEKQVIPLKRAAKKALLYREKQGQLQEIEVAVLVKEIEKYANDIETLKESLEDYDQQMVSMDAQYNVNDHKISLNREQLDELDSIIHKEQESLMSVMKDITRLESRKTELDEKSKYVLEVGNLQERTAELTNLMNQAYAEFLDRSNRLKDLKAELDLLNQQNLKNSTDIVEFNSQYEQAVARLNQLKNRRNNQQQIIDRPFITQAGVQAILQHKNNLNGIQDVVVKLLVGQEGYEQAISTSLGGSSNHIVSHDEEAAKNGIRFLKQNRSGRATFIPLSVIKPRNVYDDDLVVAKSVDGFLGLAYQFVDYDQKYERLAKNLLGNVFVTETLDQANTLARYLRFRYKIVSLEGDIFHIGGTISGGQQRENTSLIMAQKEIKALDEQIAVIQNQLISIENKRQALDTRSKELSSQVLETRLGLAQIEPIVDVKQGKYEKLKADLELLDPTEVVELNGFKDDMIDELNQAYQKRDNLVNHISLSREQRLQLNSVQQGLQVENTALRKELNQLQQQSSALKVSVGKAETSIENSMNRLASEYQMTFEYASSLESDVDLASAKDLVNELRYDINKLGSINMSAPEEFEEVNTRYEFLSNQLKELQVAKDDLLTFINEMDEIMTIQFKEMFDKINNEFNDVFTTLFGGGRAKLVLEEPDDLLNSGIDIDVQPPGKTIQNIRLFSGGEKSLIAISVLFAIMKAKNVPLVVFDEVEAALDQANVQRFANYIRKFSDDSQFIIVTHRPGTMTQCDVLYGVTMATQGVSNILRVQLKDAQSMAESGGN